MKRWGDRKDAALVRDGDGMHRIMPHLMPRRTEAEVFIQQEFDITPLMDWLNRREERGEAPVTVFQAVVAATAKTVAARPLLNRYISGRKTYQRHRISLSFVVKRQFADHAGESLLILSPRETDTIEEISRKIRGEVVAARTESGYGIDRAMDFFGRMPRFLLMGVFAVIRLLDFYGKMPGSIRKGDPNYTTVLLSNLGSIGCPPAYHHLNNYGTNSLILCVGAYEKRTVRTGEREEERWFLPVGMTADERIADGFYFARSLKVLSALLHRPELLERPLKESFSYE